MGSITELTDSTGAVARAYAYDAYGQIADEVGTLANPYAYTAREFDAESGLYFYRSRYYDAKTGRFLSEDPIGFLGLDVNLYRYVFNNPIFWVDPIGLDYWDFNITIGAGPGVTGGFIYTNGGWMGYVGAGVTTTTFIPINITWSPNEATPGNAITFTGGNWVGGQIGIPLPSEHDPTGAAPPFGEIGFVPPGGSIMIITIFDIGEPTPPQPCL